MLSLVKKLRIRGVDLGPSADLVEVLRDHFRYGSPLGWERWDSGPEESVWRLFDAVKGRAVSKRLVAAAEELLADPNPALRSQIVFLPQLYPERFDPGRLLTILDRTPAYRARRRPSAAGAEYTPLGWQLVRAMAAHPRPPSRVRTRLRRLVMNRRHGAQILAGVTYLGPAWVIRHAGEVVQGEHYRPVVILMNLRNASQREQFIRALAKQPLRIQRRALSAIDEHVKSPTERGRLRRLLERS